MLWLKCEPCTTIISDTGTIATKRKRKRGRFSHAVMIADGGCRGQALSQGQVILILNCISISLNPAFNRSSREAHGNLSLHAVPNLPAVPEKATIWTQNLHFFSVQFSHWVVSDYLRPQESQNARPPCASPTPGVYSNSWWCHPAISSSVVPFTSCPQSLPASGSLPMSQLFASGGQSTGVSASASVLPMNTQDWSPLGWTDWISLQSKGLSRVFSNTTAQMHQFFSTQLSSQSNSHIHTWLLEKP